MVFNVQEERICNKTVIVINMGYIKKKENLKISVSKEVYNQV